MGSSFRLVALKGLKKKKKKRSKADEIEGSRRKRRAMAKPDSKPSGFENIPEDIFMEIMARLPAKLVTRLMCVSQLWRSLISSRVFTNYFLESPSSAQRRRPVMYIVGNADPRRFVFVSSRPHDHSDASVTVLNRYLNMRDMGGYFVNALRGLLCVRLGRSLRICNLTTKQLVEFPVIRSRLLSEDNGHIWNFFGYDSVLDEYKVLSTVWEVSKEEEGVVRSEHQVLVLGPGASWRNTHISAIPPPHRPYSDGVSINGVLYYGALVDANNTCVVMSFHLTSEEFDLIELPVVAGIIWHIHRVTLLNYGDKLAVLDYSGIASDVTVGLWVMQDAGKKKWSSKTLVLPLLQMNFVHDDLLDIKCMSRCGEVMLAKTNNQRPHGRRRSVIYDLEKNKITRSLEI